MSEKFRNLCIWIYVRWLIWRLDVKEKLRELRE